MKHGFTLIELIIGIAIMILLAGIFEINPNIGKQTSKDEAQRLFSKLSSIVNKADLTQTDFHIIENADEVTIFWDVNLWRNWLNKRDPKQKIEKFYASKGCKYHMNIKELNYSSITNRFTPGTTITVYGERGAPYYLVIPVLGSRMRLTDTHPEQEEYIEEP